MSKSQKYTPPNLWVWDKENGGKFASINRPISGNTHVKDLPVGKHPFQLYSQGTPNGIKITILVLQQPTRKQNELFFVTGFTDRVA